MSLILHCGASHITRDQLAALPLPKSLGPRHCPYPFAEDVSLVTSELSHQGLEVVEEAYGVTYTKEGDPARYFGVLELAHDQLDHALVVGLRGSYDQSISRGLAVGSRVTVCDNLAFSGEVTYQTKQTTHIADRLPRMIAEAAQKVPQLAKLQSVRFDKYRQSKLTPYDGDAALVELFRREVLNTQTFARAVKEWDQPSHPEHAEDGFSAWRLHNACTEALKAKDHDQPNVVPVWNRTIKLTKFLDEAVQL